MSSVRALHPPQPERVTSVRADWSTVVVTDRLPSTAKAGSREKYVATAKFTITEQKRIGGVQVPVVIALAMFQEAE